MFFKESKYGPQVSKKLLQTWVSPERFTVYNVDFGLSACNPGEQSALYSIRDVWTPNSLRSQRKCNSPSKLLGYA
jgi:hypothetical protein